MITIKPDTVLHSSKDVAKRLSIQPVTVRKYAQLLENKGVSFTKDEKGWRTYSEDNIRFLEYLCNLKLMGTSLETAAEHVATLYRSNLSIAQPAISLQEEYSITEFMKAQTEFNQKLVEQLERMEQQQIERDQKLLKTILETQETKKQLAVNAQQKKWWEIWK